MESIIRKNNLIKDSMQIENYDITELNNDEKKDFEKIFNKVDNYINQQFHFYEYHNKLEELELTDWLIEKESDDNYGKFLFDK